MAFEMKLPKIFGGNNGAAAASLVDVEVDDPVLAHAGLRIAGAFGYIVAFGLVGAYDLPRHVGPAPKRVGAALKKVMEGA